MQALNNFNSLRKGSDNRSLFFLINRRKYVQKHDGQSTAATVAAEPAADSQPEQMTAVATVATNYSSFIATVLVLYFSTVAIPV